MNGIAPIDAGYIRDSAMALGGILQNAAQAQVEEVKILLNLEAQMISTVNILNTASLLIESMNPAMGANLDIIF